MTINELITKLEAIREAIGGDKQIVVLTTVTDEDGEEYNSNYEIEYVNTIFDDYAYLEIIDDGADD